MRVWKCPPSPDILWHHNVCLNVVFETFQQYIYIYIYIEKYLSSVRPLVSVPSLSSSVLVLYVSSEKEKDGKIHIYIYIYIYTKKKERERERKRRRAIYREKKGKQYT